MKKIAFGRFTYTSDFSYKSDLNAKPIFGWVTKDGRVFNCDEKNGYAVQGNVEFTNIDAQTVLESNGRFALMRNCGPYTINWWDCRINKTLEKCIRD